MERPAGTTGLGMVGRLVLGRLAALPGRDICCLGWYYDGEPYDEAVFPYRILPQGGGRTPQDNLPRALSASGGDVVVTMGDPWSLEWVADLRAQRDFAWIAYLTIDSRPLSPSAVGYLTQADAVDLPPRRAPTPRSDSAGFPPWATSKAQRSQQPPATRRSSPTTAVVISSGRLHPAAWDGLL